MSVEENVELMRRWFNEVWNEGRIESIRELMAPDAIGIGELEDGGELRGPADFVPFVERVRSAFPDIKIVVDDAFGAGDKVVLRWTATMTHAKDSFGIPATSKKIRVSGTSIVQIVNGKIVAGWDNWDRLGMLEQIGAYTAPDTAILAKTA